MDRLDTFPNDDLIRQYRNVFSSPEGPIVIGHMLYELGVFEDMQNISAEDAALKNYGSRLLKILGGGEVKEVSTKAFLKQLIMQPLEKVEE